jgi:BT1 family
MVVLIPFDYSLGARASGRSAQAEDVGIASAGGVKTLPHPYGNLRRIPIMNHTSESAASSAVSGSSMPKMSLRRYSILVCWGMVVTNLGQFPSLGDLPLKFLLKDVLLVSPTAMAAWFTVAILPWSFKPLAALLVDGVPLRGSRHRNYLLLGALFGGCLWLAMALVPKDYQALLIVGCSLNVMMVLTSTVIGGLLVEGGQAHGATGRLSSVRMIVANVIFLFVGPLGGYLATKWFGWTAFIGAFLYFSMVPVAIWVLREKRTMKQQGGGTAMEGVSSQIRVVLGSKNIWICSGLLFLVHLAPGFGTPLFYYKSEVLKFSEQFIGNLTVIGGVMGLVGALLYPLLCRRFHLRALLYLSISSTVLSSLCYLGYVSKSSAIVIEAVGLLGYTLAQLPLFDLAARATPKGSEALGYAVMLALANLSTSISDVVGSYLFDHFKLGFKNLVWVNAGTTALVLIVIPFLPGYLVNKKEGENMDRDPA